MCSEYPYEFIIQGNSMSYVTENLKPAKVFKYFEDLCRIPHGSGDTKRISDYCVDFAQKRELDYIQDDFNNVIIYKSGSKGRENEAPVIIQGHLDMVCEKENDVLKDFKEDGLDLFVDGDFLKAKGTTLGGDDGIAVAMALAVLDSQDISHPPIEAVFTVDEEIGMLGAAAIDCSSLKGNIMLNLDSEEEGHLLVSCAGGVTATAHIPVKCEKILDGFFIEIAATGMQGGHSGVEIDKGRANSNMVMGRVLYELSKIVEFNLVCVNGGLKDNAIPRETKAVICTRNKEDESCIDDFIENINIKLKNEYRLTDKEIEIYTETSEKTEEIMDLDSTKRVISALFNMPGGIVKMSRDIEGLVQTSLNMGILKTKFDKGDKNSNEVTLSYSVRSSIKSEKDELVEKISCLSEILGGYTSLVGEYPAWEYKSKSKLRDLMIKIYKDKYGMEPVIEAIHAGVECGLFAGKINDLDCVSFGPDILDIHTPKERLSISSVERTWEYVLEILQKI